MGKAVQVDHHQYLSLPDQTEFTYLIQTAEIKNMLGIVVATLQEFVIFRKQTMIFSIYKTAEGNWYEVTEKIPVNYFSLLPSIKSAIDIRLQSK